MSSSQLRIDPSRGGVRKYSASRTGRNRKRNVGSVNSTVLDWKVQCSRRLAGLAGGFDRAGLAFEGEVDRHGAEEEEQAERAPARPVDGTEAGVFARLEHQVVGLPEQRVVRLQAMRPRSDLERNRLAVPEDRDLLTVERDEH